MLAVDDEVGFVTGLCVGRMWSGDPVRQLDPWRDTGVEIRGPAVQDIERAFARICGGGSAGRAAAGAVRIGNAVGAAIAGRRVLGPVEARAAAAAGLLLCVVSVFFFLSLRVLDYPVVVLCAWGGLALLYRAVRLFRRKLQQEPKR